MHSYGNMSQILAVGRRGGAWVMFGVAGADADAYAARRRAVDDGAPAAVSLTHRRTLASAITTQLRSYVSRGVY